MIRIVVQSASAGMAVNVGGPVQISVYTFDIYAPQLEAVLSEPRDLGFAQVIGAHVLPGPLDGYHAGEGVSLPKETRS